MKKILVAAVAVVFGLTAASAEVKNYLDFGISVPVISDMDTDSGVDSDVTVGFGIEASYRAMFTDVFGLYAQFGFNFPQKEEVKGDYDYDLEQSDFDAWWGCNMLVGPAIMPLQNDKFGLTIAPGLAILTNNMEADSLYGLQDAKLTYTMLGLGCNAGFDIYLNDKFYLKPAVELDFYFHQWTKLESKHNDEDDDESCSLFMFKPSISFGFRF